MKIIISLILFTDILLLIFFLNFENWLLNFDFSWTISKALPYALLIVSGFLLAFLFIRLNVIKTKMGKYFFTLFLFIAPFSVGFILNPIYEGDFSMIGKPISKKETLSDFKNSDLSVIAIPGCSYCFGSIAKLKFIKKRNPKIRIKFIVCSNNEKELIPYKNEVKRAFNVELSGNIEKTFKLVNSSFPAFIQIKNDVAIYKWSNDQFGVKAIDKLETDYNCIRK